MARHVAVTGAAGQVGAALCASLERRSDVSRVVGIDCRDVPSRTRKLEPHALDIRDPAIARALKGCDTVVHLAFCVEAMRDERLMRDVNVGGFRNLLDAVAGAGVERLVHVSSGYVYGSHHDLASPVSETASLRPSHAFSYAEHKAECEAILRDWPDRGARGVTVLRPAPVVGRRPAGFLARRLLSRFLPTARGHRPVLQLLHEEDLVRALVHFGLDADPGTFNLAASAPVGRDDLVRLTGLREVLLPLDALVGLADLAWKAGLTPFQPGEWDVLVDPHVLGTEAAAGAGWQPQSDSARCVTELVAVSRRRPVNPIRRRVRARAA